MNGRDLDAALGEALGLCAWFESWNGKTRALVSWAVANDLEVSPAETALPRASDWNKAPIYSLNREDCALAEAKVIEMGLGEAYGDQVLILMREVPGAWPSWKAWLTAPPEIRCRAMWQVLQAQAGK